ncbi:DNA/RNA non-specific endonuclease [Campylobacter canadensis]|uniref:DNA/RNA non-specific endonuclease n=1 Tax=Campylobacter canadensis TaxID=449520 RepID=UPI001CCB90F5|nr:DNA/RNA non-specific endonuclease [Campylobacter canadensis]MBZ8002742.1 DNA/RNA non-specific endonuclease [Campylobacter canadensis]
MKRAFLFFAITMSCLASDNIQDKFFIKEVPQEFKKFFKSCDKILHKNFYINCYNYKYKGTTAVIYNVFNDSINSEISSKRPKFLEDYELPKKQRVYYSDYTNSGFDRGHIANNHSFSFSPKAQLYTFYLSNIVPQLPEINRKVWLKVERRERQLASYSGGGYST